MTDQAIFFSNPPNFYGTEFAGKEEAINGRFYEMVVAEGGEYLDAKGKPAFNSEAGVRALDWFVNLYKAKAVPPGTTNYLWDDLGQGFASGTVALDLDWPGWATFFNDPKSSKAAGNVGIVVQPAGSSGKHTGWSGSARLLGDRGLRPQGRRGFAGLVADQRRQPEDRGRPTARCRPAPPSGNGTSRRPRATPTRRRCCRRSRKSAKYAFPVPPLAEWIEISNVVYPELQAAILGDKTSKAGARRRRRQGDQDPAGRRQALTAGHGRRAFDALPPPVASRIAARERSRRVLRPGR